MVAAYNPATARGGAKIRFVSRFDILLNILYEISPLEEKLARLSHRRERNARRRGKGRVIDVTPQPGRLPDSRNH